MFEAGTRVTARIEGELEHVVPSRQGLRASIKIGNGVSLTVPYPDLSPAGPAQPKPNDECPVADEHYLMESCSCGYMASPISLADVEQRTERAARAFYESFFSAGEWARESHSSQGRWIDAMRTALAAYGLIDSGQALAAEEGTSR
ncbi:hypothetical protein Leucomu_11205 [Leucobacter muris]|uniref:Uncharacterized protein n=1 Tax=Leucobacter muris TaxID=1935379 RepID=A0ABX5QHG6_9MICO|nr:hypothetical protein [Leucobacter muris]QAB17111.1 hypothetical protein Leucomu_03520 [Leucobacter muris]QAB18406.1 hypothetical protein Leucomu_11205 [Leucobacter muris]